MVRAAHVWEVNLRVKFKLITMNLKLRKILNT
jgi:hypothetical protein